MRFFSNDAKDSADEQGSDEYPERVQSEPVAVPQQRAGSPWSDPRSPADATPAQYRPADPGPGSANADAEVAEKERTDGSLDSGTPVNGYDPAPSDAPVSSDESPAAPVVDGLGTHRVEDDDPQDNADNVPAADVDDEQDSDPLAVRSTDDERDDSVDVPLEEPETVDDPQAQDYQRQSTLVQDETIDTATDATPADERPVATTTTYGPDGIVTTTTGQDDSPESDLDSAAASDADLATSDAVVVAESGSDEPAGRDEGGFADSTAVDPVTEEPLDPTPTDDEPTDTEPTDDEPTDTDAAPDVVPVPVPVGSADQDRMAEDGTADDGEAAASGDEAAASGDKLPGSVTAPELGSLFAQVDAQGFHDRWREVQLRFVDSPKEATAEAARLVDEAVDKLTASLKAQKDQVANDNSDDTEELRVELRGYRDILNRVLTL